MLNEQSEKKDNDPMAQQQLPLPQAPTELNYQPPMEADLASNMRVQSQPITLQS